MFDSAQLTPHPLLPGLLDLHQSDGGSGASTPPLWRNSPPDTPIRSGDIYRSLSPASRTQAILRGQQELIEMVRNMPESSYELSLKDLVELPPPPRPHVLLDQEKRPSIDGDGNRVMEIYGRRGYGYGNRTTMMTARCGSMGKGQQQQEGLLLKMVFPVYTGAATARGRRTGNRRQRKERSEEDSSAAEKEWWRKRDGDSENGDSLYSSTIGGSGKSSGSGSSSGSSRSNSANSNSNSIVAVR